MKTEMIHVRVSFEVHSAISFIVRNLVSNRDSVERDFTENFKHAKHIRRRRLLPGIL